MSFGTKPLSVEELRGGLERIVAAAVLATTAGFENAGLTLRDLVFSVPAPGRHHDVLRAIHGDGAGRGPHW